MRISILNAEMNIMHMVVNIINIMHINIDIIMIMYIEEYAYCF